MKAVVCLTLLRPLRLPVCRRLPLPSPLGITALGTFTSRPSSTTTWYSPRTPRTPQQFSSTTTWYSPRAATSGQQTPRTPQQCPIGLHRPRASSPEPHTSCRVRRAI
ncbi:Hypothetical predicted protein [Pelobates cultripes]|uniref:Uncharacterized protein n=1 Tax=Pelobates cultripes TaxID=61616 RepID=A0AAD1T445_PELCU|nr:Hypothetical predicted protein [Pelobates cultripes]